MQRSGIKTGIRRYMKRFFLYGIYLFMIIKYFDEKMLFAAFIGIMSIKINILIYVALERIQKHLKK